MRWRLQLQNDLLLIIGLAFLSTHPFWWCICSRYCSLAMDRVGFKNCQQYFASLCECARFCFSYVSHNETNRTSISEPDAAEEKEATDVLHSATDCWAGKAISQAKIPGVRRAGVPCENSQNDRCTSQNVVPKSQNKMEVRNDKV